MRRLLIAFLSALVLSLGIAFLAFIIALASYFFGSMGRIIASGAIMIIVFTFNFYHTTGKDK